MAAARLGAFSTDSLGRFGSWAEPDLDRREQTEGSVARTSLTETWEERLRSETRTSTVRVLIKQIHSKIFWLLFSPTVEGTYIT